MLDTRSTYQETLDWLYQQLPMYQRDGAKAYKADLKKTWALVHYLDHPHEQIKTIERKQLVQLVSDIATGKVKISGEASNA